MRNGDGGASPRSRLEKRRNIDFFLESGCGDSSAIILLLPLYANLLIKSWMRNVNPQRRSNGEREYKRK